MPCVSIDINWENYVTAIIFIAIVTYDISVEGNDISDVTATVIDKAGKYIVSNDGQTLTGKIKINNAKLWWPYLMDAEPGYLYTLRVNKQHTYVSSVPT